MDVRKVSGNGGIFSLRLRVQSGSGTQPVSYLRGPFATSLGVKQSWREADHLPPSSAEDENEWSYTSTPPLRLHGMVLS